jgi:hypothetical protein
MYSIAMEIQLSRGEGWDLINRFNITTSMCLTKMKDNINMDSTISGSMNDNINMDSTIAG